MKEFAAEYHRELNRLNAARDDHHIRQKEELDGVERQIRAVIDEIKEGLHTPGMKDLNLRPSGYEPADDMW